MYVDEGRSIAEVLACVDDPWGASCRYGDMRDHAIGREAAWRGRWAARFAALDASSAEREGASRPGDRAVSAVERPR